MHIPEFIVRLVFFAILVLFVLPWALALFPGANLKAQFMLLNLGAKAKMANRRRSAAVLGWMLRHLFMGVLARPLGLSLYVTLAADRGQTSRAVGAADSMLDATAKIVPTTCLWFMVNTAIDVYINAGCYGKALAAADRWTSSAQDRGRASETVAHAYAQINRAEALHNLGKQSDALALFDEAEPSSQSDPVCKNGLRLLRAWILVHCDRREAAKSELARVEDAALTLHYAAEYHFTRAVVECAVNDFIAAEWDARQGQLLARRASSKRNALHVLARVAFATGDMQRAIALLEQARGHRYQGQAGPCLALLGEAYEAVGKLEEARGAYAEALSLDPESYAAEKARGRLDFLKTGPVDRD